MQEERRRFLATMTLYDEVGGYWRTFFPPRPPAELVWLSQLFAALSIPKVIRMPCLSPVGRSTSLSDFPWGTFRSRRRAWELRRRKAESSRSDSPEISSQRSRPRSW